MVRINRKPWRSWFLFSTTSAATRSVTEPAAFGISEGDEEETHALCLKNNQILKKDHPPVSRKGFATGHHPNGCKAAQSDTKPGQKLPNQRGVWAEGLFKAHPVGSDLWAGISPPSALKNTLSSHFKPTPRTPAHTSPRLRVSLLQDSSKAGEIHENSSNSSPLGKFLPQKLVPPKPGV